MRARAHLLTLRLFNAQVQLSRLLCIAEVIRIFRVSFTIGVPEPQIAYASSWLPILLSETTNGFFFFCGGVVIQIENQICVFYLGTCYA
ncbi:hypothetical protein F5B21DRAFT_464903 [Xylaria acuta]|nr:hypothetical protein F5B21DRAFT_464903 [Xylaria acuta]